VTPPPAHTLLLGTAQWGWTVEKPEAFAMLDAWLNAGFSALDCATNYPINRNPGDFRAAERILTEYIKAHGLSELEVTMKIGSLDNMRSPEINLAPSFVLMMAEEYHRLLGANLSCLMFHWDNRTSQAAIAESLEALQLAAQQHHFRPGLSGIAHPEHYAAANQQLQSSFDIQVKHNVLHSDYPRYEPLRRESGHGHRFFAYGLNAGGLKLGNMYAPDSTFLVRGGQPETAAALLEKIGAALPKWNTAFVRPPVVTMNHVGLLYAGLHPGLSGLLIGAATVPQLNETLDFWRNLSTFDYSDVYSSLNKILLPT
jgi:aryl-alcohol dehydrogenase-like predicted oxidoreductase